MLINKQGQSFLDKVLQTTGGLAAAFEMALLNGISITDDVVIGQQIIKGTVENKNIVAFWQDDTREPATGLFIEYKTLQAGIGHWAVDLDFVVQ